MSQTKLVLWNANGLQQHAFELGTFLEINKIDIALISETHFTEVMSEFPTLTSIQQTTPPELLEVVLPL